MTRLSRNMQSLRVRLLLGTGAMLVPLLALAGVGYLLFQNVVAGMDRVVEDVFEELVPIAYLQSSVQRNRYLIDRKVTHHETGGRQEFTELTENIDSTFARLANEQTPLPPDIRDDIATAHQIWQRMKDDGQSLLTDAHATMASPRMLRFHSDFDMLERTLQRSHTHILRGINVQMKRAQKTRWNVLVLIGTISVIGLLLAITATIVLTRTILSPLAELERAAERFGAGDLQYRIQGMPPHELGKVARTFNAMADTIERHQSSLRNMAVRDALTGLYNRREFKARLGTELERARRYSHPFALLMMDIDHFKMVNDTYGHPAGDRLLLAFASKLHDCTRPVDSLARYGGEEFALILPEVRAEEAMLAAERLREQIAAEPFTLGEHVVSMTVSIGVAIFPQHGRHSDTLFRHADRALYRAKETGRNHVALAEPDEVTDSVPS